MTTENVQGKEFNTDKALVVIYKLLSMLSACNQRNVLHPADPHQYIVRSHADYGNVSRHGFYSSRQSDFL